MSSGMIAAGLGLAAFGYGARILLRNARHAKAAQEAIKQTLDSQGFMSKYYRGGFEAKMSKSEAAKVLGISVASPKNRVKDAHKRVMIANHPDKGGSPYLAAKINEAKDLLDNPNAAKR